MNFLSDFQYPLVFFLLPLPYLVTKINLSIKHIVLVAKFASNYRHLINKQKKNKQIFLRWFIWIMLLVSLANPYKIIDVSNVVHEKDYVLVLDSSYSMQEELSNNIKFTEAKKIINNLLLNYNMNVGLVVFGFNAYLASPITTYFKDFIKILDRIKIGVADENEESGSSINDALFIAIDELKKYKGNDKNIILFTDGEDTNSRISMEDVIAKASTENVKINVVLFKNSISKELSMLADNTGGKILLSNEANNLKLLIDGGVKNEVFEKKSLFKIPLWIAFLSLILLIIRFRLL